MNGKRAIVRINLVDGLLSVDANVGQNDAIALMEAAKHQLLAVAMGVIKPLESGPQPGSPTTSALTRVPLNSQLQVRNVAPAGGD